MKVNYFQTDVLNRFVFFNAVYLQSIIVHSITMLIIFEAMTTLHIKNMVCDRCKMVVNQELEKLGFHPEKVALGEVILAENDLSADQQRKIDDALIAVGFERIDDRKARLIENMKNKIIQIIHHSDRINLKVNLVNAVGR